MIKVIQSVSSLSYYSSLPIRVGIYILDMVSMRTCPSDAVRLDAHWSFFLN